MNKMKMHLPCKIHSMASVERSILAKVMTKFRQPSGLFRMYLAGVSATVLYLVLSNGAVAGPYQAPESKTVNFQGVDLARGAVSKSQTFLTIGDPANAGLAWSFSGVANFNSFTGFIHQDTIPTYATMTVSVGEATHVFYGGATTSAGNNYATLAHVGATWVMTDKGGTVYTYDELVTSTVYDKFSKLISIQKPNGTIITINYNTCSGGNENCKIRSVVSNQGYALKYDYNASGNLIKVWAVNTMAHTCDATVTSCDAYDNYITLPTSGQVTDALNYTTSLVSNWTGVGPDHLNMALQGYGSPTGYQVVPEYDYYGRVTTITDSLGVWTYTYSDTTQVQIDQAGYHTVTVTGPDNAVVEKARVSKPYSDVLYTIDPLNRQTNYAATAFVAPGSFNTVSSKIASGVTLPEGNSSAYAFDARGNVTTVTNTPKSGSGLTATSITASYPASCTYPKTCNQPTWTKDAKLNQTDYTYDNNHGGVLTVTLPADQNALRNRTYNTYTAFSSGSGNVYRLTRTETCGLTSVQLSLTACPALSTTSVTLIDYGTSTTAPKTYKTSSPLTVTKTDGASSLSATTTYAYDNLGNVVSVDGPLAGTADQSFTTYEANRRKIFEIGPIPGGNGTQKRTLVRHMYDGSGHEIQTAQGYASSNATNGTDAVIISYSQMNYDVAGRLTSTLVETTGNVAP